MDVVRVVVTGEAVVAKVVIVDVEMVAVVIMR